MANFLEAHEKTAKYEGGYTKNPADNGNWTGGKIGVGALIGTNYGISALVLAIFLGRTPTVDEMKSLSPEMVQKIYLKNYWDKMCGDKINSQLTANKLYDNCVNMGVTGAIAEWQRDVLFVPITRRMDEVTLNKINQQ